MIPESFRSTPAHFKSDRLKILVPSADQRISRVPVQLTWFTDARTPLGLRTS